VSNVRRICELWIGKNVERYGLGLYQGNIPENVEGLRKEAKASVRIICIQAQV
jgi:hypothetical protein